MQSAVIVDQLPLGSSDDDNYDVNYLSQSDETNPLTSIDFPTIVSDTFHVF